LLVARQRRAAEPTLPADPELRTVRVLSAIVGLALVGGATALFVAPAQLGEHWVWPLTPLLARTVAAWYALFGTMLLSCAVTLRRAAEATVAYATLAAWSVLLLALPLLYPSDVTGAGPWIALMLVLLGLSAHALRFARRDRGRL
jgi:cell division protein FtsW (lipid II flippase)